MKALLDEFAQAVAAEALAVQVSIGHGGKNSPLALAATARREKARDALEDAIIGAVRHLGEITSLADDVRTEKRILRATDPTVVATGSEADWSRVGVDRYRKPTMKDAKRNAEMIARRAREAWELLDPSLPSR